MDNKNLLSIFLQKVIFKRVKTERTKNYLKHINNLYIYSIREQRRYTYIFIKENILIIKSIWIGLFYFFVDQTTEISMIV